VALTISEIVNASYSYINTALQYLLMLTRSMNIINHAWFFFALCYTQAMRKPQTLQKCSLQRYRIILICTHAIKHRLTGFN